MAMIGGVQVLIREGTRSDAMFIVLRGRIGVYVGATRVSSMGAGGFFGEQSLLSGKAAGATIVCDTFCEVYKCVCADART
jgi:CRP-like cAMP-binding protein